MSGSALSCSVVLTSFSASLFLSSAGVSINFCRWGRACYRSIMSEKASVHSTCKKLSHRMLEVKRDAVLTADKGRFPSNIQYLLLQWMMIRLSLKRGQIKTRHTYSKSLIFAHSVQFSSFKPERTRQTKALSGNFLHVL